MALVSTDLFVIERGGVLYKLTAAEIAAFTGGGSGGIAWTTLVLPLSTPFVEETSVTHTDASVSPTSNIIVFFVSSDDNELSDYRDDNIQIFATALTGQIRFDILGTGLLVGPYTIKYGVS